MTIALSVVAQLVHIALMGAAAPTLLGVCHWIEARLAAHTGPSPLQPWHDLRRLLRKQSVLASNASPASTYGPVMALAFVAVAASLVPSFTLGMAFAPVGDLLLIFGLLMIARIALALAAMDAGTTAGGIWASRSTLRWSLAEPSCVLVVFVLAILAGSTNVDVIAGMQTEQIVQWRAGLGMLLATTALVALVDVLPCDLLSLEFGGRELALTEMANALRLLVWFNLLGALFLPVGMAELEDAPIAWLLGVIAWLSRSVLFIVALALLRTSLGRISQRRAARTLSAALLLGLLAAAFTLTSLGGA
jgi:formate hydrogenlyase subunit 4